jgi:anti-anti-sigma factor
LSSRREGDSHTLSPTGELDVATAPELDSELQRVEASDARAIVLDLSELTFIDSTGIRLAVLADERAQASGKRLMLVRPAPDVFRVFEICGIADRLAFGE